MCLKVRDYTWTVAEIEFQWQKSLKQCQAAVVLNAGSVMSPNYVIVLLPQLQEKVLT